MVRRRASSRRTTTRRRPRAASPRRSRDYVPDEDERRWIEPRAAVPARDRRCAAGGRDELFAAWRTFFERVAAHGTDASSSSRISTGPTRSARLHRPPARLVARPCRSSSSPWRDRSCSTGAGLGRGPAQLRRALARATARRRCASCSGAWCPACRSSARTILGRAGGVPLYAVETVRMLVAEGGSSGFGEATADRRPSALRSPRASTRWSRPGSTHWIPPIVPCSRTPPCSARRFSASPRRRLAARRGGSSRARPRPSRDPRAGLGSPIAGARAVRVHPGPRLGGRLRDARRAAIARRGTSRPPRHLESWWGADEDEIVEVGGRALPRGVPRGRRCRGRPLRSRPRPVPRLRARRGIVLRLASPLRPRRSGSFAQAAERADDDARAGRAPGERRRARAHAALRLVAAAELLERSSRPLRRGRRASAAAAPTAVELARVAWQRRRRRGGARADGGGRFAQLSVVEQADERVAYVAAELAPLPSSSPADVARAGRRPPTSPSTWRRLAASPSPTAHALNAQATGASPCPPPGARRMRSSAARSSCCATSTT